jgi:hypothetical protein
MMAMLFKLLAVVTRITITTTVIHLQLIKTDLDHRLAGVITQARAIALQPMILTTVIDHHQAHGYSLFSHMLASLLIYLILFSFRCVRFVALLHVIT